MRSAHKLIPLLVMAAGLGACQREQSDQNITINNNIAGADIEALPPDESSVTPTDELENGTDNADVADLNASTNSY